MADRSQHPWQIMENQARYDLNAAIENWRQELAKQASLTPEIRRELETHLRDAIAGFQQRGLNDEESFWLASRRVGQPPQLSEEFAKADPAKVWRQRIVWFLSALFVINLWRSFFNALYLMILPQVVTLPQVVPGYFYEHVNIQNLDFIPLWQRDICEGLLQNLSPAKFVYVVAQLVFSLPIAWLAISIARGRTFRNVLVFRSLWDSRRRFVIVGVTMTFVC